MADVITRLKLESGEYDSKIKRAVTGLQRMEDECRKVGGTLAILEKDQKQYVESLGRMQTVSTSVRGKIGELSNAYVELRSQYNRLTQEEKKGDFGKALSASLDQLKTRINDSKKELNDINAELGNTRKEGSSTSTILEDLAGKFGMNVGQLLKFGTAAGTVTAALKVGKDAFFENESTLDEWGRTVQASQSLYSSFLTALNNGDISGFLSNMSQIVSAAKEAYNAMDELNTNNAFAQRQDAQNRAGYQEALEQYKLKPTKENKAKLDQANKAVVANLQKQYKETEKAYIKGLRSIGTNQGLKGKDLQNFVNLFANSTDRYALQKAKQGYSTGRGLNAGAQYWNGNRVYDGRIQVNGKWRDMTAQESQRFNYARALTQVNDTKIQEIQGFGAQSVALREQMAQQNRQYNRLAGNNGKPTTPPPAPTTTNIPKPKTTKTKIVEEVFPEGSMKDLQRDMQELKKAQDLVTSPDEWQKYQQQIDAVTEKMNTLKGVVKQAPEMTTGASGLNQKAISTYQSMLQESMKGMEYGSTDLTNTLANSIDVTTLSNLLTATMQQGINMTAIQLADGTTAADLWDRILGGENIPDSTWENLQTIINEKLAELGIDPIKVNFQTGDISKPVDDGKQLAKNWQLAGTAIQAVGSAMSQIEDPAAKVMGTIAQAVATVALTFAASLKGTFTPWDWIAAAAAGTATMISTISAIHSATGYAEGGMIKGTSYSGDNIMANGGAIGLNAGELVLNKAQQFNLASQLEDNGNQGTTPSRPYVSGEQIYLGLNNYLRRSGRGEIVTSR